MTFCSFKKGALKRTRRLQSRSVLDGSCCYKSRALNYIDVLLLSSSEEDGRRAFSKVDFQSGYNPCGWGEKPVMEETVATREGGAFLEIRKPLFSLLIC